MMAYLCGTAADDPFPWISMLPNEILLEIFDCHRLATLENSSDPWKWHRLAHVCQRWRGLIFESPRRLDLRLVYTYKNPLRKSLDLWPDLPLSVWYPRSPRNQRLAPEDEENVLAVLKHANRICEINLSMTRQLASKSAGSLKAAFPNLQRLQLRSQETMRPLLIPGGFLGGSTPLLRDIHLVRTIFPTLPVLLLSAQVLVSRFDAPALGQINITFIDQPTFGIPRLARFIGRTKEARSPHHTSVRLS